MIAEMDSAISDSQIRRHWLDCLMIGLKSIKLELKFSGVDYVEDVIDWIILKKLNLLEFCVFGSEENITITNHTMKKLVQYNPNLKKLIFNDFAYQTFSDYDRINDKCLQHIATFCHNLEELSFSCSKDDDNDIDEDIASHPLKCLTNICKSNKKLKSFTISGLSYSHPQFFNLGTYCPLLESLVMTDNKNSMVSYPTYEEIDGFTQGCRNLKHLEIRCPMKAETVDKLLQCLSTYNPLLELLHVTVDDYDNEDDSNDDNDNAVQDSSFTCLFKGCPLLKDIKLNNFQDISTKIFANANNITHLCLEECIFIPSASDIYVEIGKMKNLKSISLHRCYGGTLNDASLTKLITQNSHTLEVLNLMEDTGFQFTNASLSNIASKCPNLKKICICFYYSNDKVFTMRDCRELMLRLKCEKLEEIKINSKIIYQKYPKVQSKYLG